MSCYTFFLRFIYFLENCWTKRKKERKKEDEEEEQEQEETEAAVAAAAERTEDKTERLATHQTQTTTQSHFSVLSKNSTTTKTVRPACRHCPQTHREQS